MCYNSKKKGLTMNITIPEFPLPFPIPELIHPLFVHFAIALPVIWLILELINLVAKRRLLSGITLFFALLNVVIFFGAYLTGNTDAKAANVTLEALNFHKELGVYLVYGSVVVLFFKLLSFAISKTQMKILFILSLLIFIGVTFVEGKKGGELVYKYGINVTKATLPKAKETTTPTTKEESHTQEATKTEAATPKEETQKTEPHTQKEENKQAKEEPTKQTQTPATQEHQEEPKTTEHNTSTETTPQETHTQKAQTHEENQSKEIPETTPHQEEQNHSVESNVSH